MKKSYYFSHDYNARNDEKIQRLMQKHWMSWVGIFWCIVEMLYEQDWFIQEDYDCIAFVLHEECERIRSVIQDFWLFIINDWNITSKTVSDRIWYMKQKSQKAKESAEERRNNRNANALQTQSKGNANKVKEKKVKEIKNIEYITSKEEMNNFVLTLSEEEQERVKSKRLAIVCLLDSEQRYPIHKDIKFMRDWVEWLTETCTRYWYVDEFGKVTWDIIAQKFLVMKERLQENKEWKTVSLKRTVNTFLDPNRQKWKQNK